MMLRLEAVVSQSMTLGVMDNSGRRILTVVRQQGEGFILDECLEEFWRVHASLLRVTGKM